MGAVIRMPDRTETGKRESLRVRAPRSTEQRFRYPGPDAVSEVSCVAARRRTRRENVSSTGSVRRVG